MNNLMLITNELIPVYKNEEGQKLVNARELHEWLGVGKDFTSWIKDRINQYGFIENVDYTSFTEIGEREVGATRRSVYVITLDMAKELSMVERTLKGKEARQYFIKCEEKLKEVSSKQLSPMEQLRLQYQALEMQEKKIEGVAKKVDDLEANMALFNVECKELQNLVRRVGTKVLGGYKSPAYCSNSLRGKVYSDIQHQLRREFGIERYEAIKRSQLDTAKKIVESYKAPLVLVNEIDLINSQLSFSEEAV